MANQNKKTDSDKRPKFNSYWIIAVIVLGFMAITFFDSSLKMILIELRLLII